MLHTKFCGNRPAVLEKISKGFFSINGHDGHLAVFATT